MTFQEKMDSIDNMQDLILDALGPEMAYTELCKALDYDTKEQMFEWIIRCWDLGGAKDGEI